MVYMYLMVCPTHLESKTITGSLYGGSSRSSFMISGFGMVESAISLTRRLETDNFDGVILFGTAGAYQGGGANLLDICLAIRESFGDLGLAKGNEILPFDLAELNKKITFSLQNDLLHKVERSMKRLDIPYERGNFVTVNSSSGSKERGASLAKRFDAICENMEGAALARVCQIYHTPLVEIRCVSNMVGVRDRAAWKLEEAAAKISSIVDNLALEALLETD
ncbi:MAG: futalosine hydrolase [Actinomycetota bacterium]|nr:futalosine hydrolase [Actinomycetota bacterium]